MYYICIIYVSYIYIYIDIHIYILNTSCMCNYIYIHMYIYIYLYFAVDCARSVLWLYMLCYSAILKCSKIESPESKARPQGSGRHAAPPGRKSKAPSPQILSALEIGNGGMNVVTTMKTLSSSLYSPLEYPYTNHSTRPYNNPPQEERSCQASNHSPRWRRAWSKSASRRSATSTWRERQWTSGTKERPEMKEEL